MKFNEYDQVKLVRDQPDVSEHPFTQLEEPRLVTTNDRGVIVLVYNTEKPGYEVEFFDEAGNTVDLLTLHECEIVAWEERASEYTANHNQP